MFILALATGFAVNAGQVNWSAWDDSGSAATDLAIYIMEGSLATGSTIDSITDSASAATAVASAVDASTLDHTDGFYAEGSILNVTGSHNYYAVLFDAATVGAASNYQVFGTYTTTAPENGGIGLEMDLTGLTSSGWTAISGSTPPTPGPGGVPEPTSGLLLALGGAMLALRRRRA